MKIKMLLLSLMALALLSGCTILNPYEENFKCPKLENGKCVSMQMAYDISKEDTPNAEISCDNCNDKECKKKCKKKCKKGCKKGKGTMGGGDQDLTPLEDYQISFYGELKTLIDKPETPLVVPPKVMRVLILDYQDGEEGSGDRNLFGKRHVYMMVDQPRWIFGN